MRSRHSYRYCDTVLNRRFWLRPLASDVRSVVRSDSRLSCFRFIHRRIELEWLLPCAWHSRRQCCACHQLRLARNSGRLYPSGRPHWSYGLRRTSLDAGFRGGDRRALVDGAGTEIEDRPQGGQRQSAEVATNNAEFAADAYLVADAGRSILLAAAVPIGKAYNQAVSSFRDGFPALLSKLRSRHNPQPSSPALSIQPQREFFLNGGVVSQAAVHARRLT